MRVIAGKYKSKRFHPPKKIPTRPTTDIAKESLFNTLNQYFNFDRIRFLDLFSGTGSISYEIASRGCTDVTSVEIYPKCVRFIEKTSREWNIAGHKVIQDDVFHFIKKCNEQFDLIFAGPPYPLPNLPTLPDLVLEHDLIEGNGWFVLEHNPDHNFDDHPAIVMRRNYGQTNFSIFSPSELV